MLFFVLACVLLISASNASAAGPTYAWQNVDSGSDHWTEAGSPYIVNNTITVPTGVTLTVDANVMVRVDPGQQIIVDGTLVANGEAAKIVTFTKNNTITGWNGITGNDNSLIRLNYANIDNDTQMTIHNSGIFTNSKFSNALFSSIFFQIASKDGNLTVTNCNFVSTLAGINDITGFIAVSSNAGIVKTVNVPMSISNNYFGPGMSGTAIMITENVISNDISSVTLNGNMVINNNQFNVGARPAMAITRNIDAFDNSTVTVNGGLTIDTNRFECGPAVSYINNINVHNLASPSMTHINSANVVSRVHFVNNDIRSASSYGLYDSASIVAYGERTSSITDPITATGNNFTLASGDAILIQRTGTANENAGISFIGDNLIDSNKVLHSTNAFTVLRQVTAANTLASSASLTGNVGVTNNLINEVTGKGLYVNDRISANSQRSSALTGSVTVTGNMIHKATGRAIDINRDGMNSYGSSRLNITGAITVSGNTAMVTGQMIHVVLVNNAYGSSELITTGDILIQNNQAPDIAGSGIEVFLNSTATSYGTVTTVGNLQVLDNSIETAGSLAMNVQRELITSGNAKGTTNGGFNVLRNTVVVENSNAFSVNNIVSASDNSTALLVGDLTVSNNIVSVYSNSAFTIQTSALADVTLAGKSSTAIYMGNVLISDNKATLTGANGDDIQFYVWFNGKADAAQFMSGQGNKWANVTLGNIQVLHNTVVMNGHDGIGLEYDPDLRSDAAFGGSSSVIAGTQLVANNAISGAGNALYGIKFDLDYLHASSNTGNSTVFSGPISIRDNNLDLKGNNSFGINLYNYVVSREMSVDDVFATANSHWLASFKIYGGLSFNRNIIMMNGAGNTGIMVDSGTSMLAAVDELNSQAVLDFNLTISNNVLTMPGSNSLGIVLENYHQYVFYFDGNVTLSSAVTVMNNNVKLNSITGEGIQVKVRLESDSTSFNGRAAVNAKVSIMNNLVTKGSIGINVSSSGDSMIFVSGNKVTGTYACAILVEQSNAVLEDNVLTDNDGNGLELVHNQASTHIVVGNNTITHNAMTGLWIATSNGVTLYNGIFQDNLGFGINVPTGSQVSWIIDSVASVKDNDMVFFGNVEIRSPGALALDAVNNFEIGEADTGVTMLRVDLGASMVLRNSNIFSANGRGLFLVYGNLEMTSSTESGWSELYLANTSSAQITASTISNNDRNGIRIDGSNPTISSCTISSNGMDGLFIDSGSRAIIKSCLVLSNERGLYARSSTLDNVVDNIFALNSVAGVYTEGTTGKIYANIFLMNNNEIFVLDSALSIEDNEIGYAHIIDQMARYTTLVSLLSYIQTSGTLDSVRATGSLEGVLPMGGITDMASLLLNHIGVHAVNSDVVAKGNTYGLLAYAVYAENSTISFSDTVQSNTILIQWLNSNLDTKNITIPTFVYNGIYLINSKLTMTGGSIQCQNDALFLDDSRANISRSALNASRFDIYSVHQSRVNMSASTMDGMLKIEDGGLMTWFNQFTVIVTDADGNLVSGAPVTIVDGNGKMIASGVTDSNGQYLADVPGWTQNENGKQTVSAPYWVNATVNGKVISQTADGRQTQTLSAQAQRSMIDVVMLPLLLIVALVVVVVVIAVVLRIRKN